jgi:hypothetical protein
MLVLALLKCKAAFPSSQSLALPLFTIFKEVFLLFLLIFIDKTRVND